jgi:hypothetical protein
MAKVMKFFLGHPPEKLAKLENEPGAVGRCL